ncbi:MAG: hypothetical protein EBT95_10760, partial [Verrucomicrobia bacterium]|nr:hypothetical protein [Verrucomicrobiota bacterium]
MPGPGRGQTGSGRPLLSAACFDGDGRGPPSAGGFRQGGRSLAQGPGGGAKPSSPEGAEHQCGA